jgi:hypothetical protein
MVVLTVACAGAIVWCTRKTVVGRIALVGLIVVLGMLFLAAQRYFANKRLANKRRNTTKVDVALWGFLVFS